MKAQAVYLVEIGLVPCKAPHDEGLTFRIWLPARSRKHAIARVRRYISGRIVGCWPVDKLLSRQHREEIDRIGKTLGRIEAQLSSLEAA